ncbi:hypothetical protein [Halosimplex salinum]|uniref:hypothetical protein n=1 Tax=Halosimplex salinum TaxID=1710538 RepID=UPI000F466022|nr:hypothetical protein [Halosimplex salinum]
MSSEHADGKSAAGTGDGDRSVSVFGVEVVLEEDFVSFPWRAGLKRGPIVFLVGFAVVSLLSALASVTAGGSLLGYVGVLIGTAALFALVSFLVGLGEDAERWHGYAGAAALLAVTALLNVVVWNGAVPFEDQFAILGIVTYNAHNIHAVTGLVPDALAPVAEPILAVPVVGRLLQGLFAIGQNHSAPVAHLIETAGGATGTIGHVNMIEQQTTQVPKLLYYLVPVAVLIGAGHEFAETHWEAAATDSPIEVARFGLAVGLGYVATLLAGTVAFTYRGQSPLNPQVYTVMPDRYLTLVFGFVYPAVLVSVGAAIVYLRREQ